MAVPLTLTPFAAGLNNQRLALLGLVIAAQEQGRAVTLPPLLDYRHGDATSPARALGDILDEPGFIAAIEACDVLVQRTAGAEPLDPTAMMALGSGTVADRRRNGDMAGFTRLCRLLAAMRPAPRLADRAERLLAWLATRRIDTGCAMRIERDWLYWAQVHAGEDRVDPGGVLYLEHGAILAKIARTLPDLRAIYVTVNEDDLPAPREVIRAEARERHDIELLFRSDGPAVAADGPLEGATIDFAVALALPRFIGMTRSSYFTLLGLTAHGEGRAADHWLYNNRGPLLKRRTDQGAFSRPYAAANA